MTGIRRGIALFGLLLLAACEQKSAPLPQVSAPAAPQPASATASTPPGRPATPSKATASAADISAGRAKYSTFCAGCHGPKAEGIAHYPRLAGQPSAIIETKLATFRSGQKIGPLSGSMIPIARMLTEAEVKQVAAYLGSL